MEDVLAVEVVEVVEEEEEEEGEESVVGGGEVGVSCPPPLPLMTRITLSPIWPPIKEAASVPNPHTRAKGVAGTATWRKARFFLSTGGAATANTGAATEGGGG